jgi:hypothetical protein
MVQSAKAKENRDRTIACRIDDAEIDTDIKIRLFDILDGEADWAKSRNCTDAERWKHKKTGEMIRCEDYCLVKNDCPQFNEEEK